MVKFSDKGSGWHKDSARHSKARSTGHAGGTYAEERKPNRVGMNKALLVKKVLYPKTLVGGKVPKGAKNMTFKQLARRGVFLPYQGDADKDGVVNVRDCRPLNRNRQDLKPGILTQSNNHSMEYLGKGKYKLTLGNLSDAGWFWDGNQNDLGGFIVRMSDSKVKDDFLKDLKDSDVQLSDMKEAITKSIKKKNGLYEISGDNRVWKFGEDFSESEVEEQLDAIAENEVFTEEEADAFKEYFWRNNNGSWADYDKFEKEYKKEYVEKMSEAVNGSDSFESLLRRTVEIKEHFQQELFEFQSEKISMEASRLLPKFKKNLGKTASDLANES